MTKEDEVAEFNDKINKRHAEIHEKIAKYIIENFTPEETVDNITYFGLIQTFSNFIAFYTTASAKDLGELNRNLFSSYTYTHDRSLFLFGEKMRVQQKAIEKEDVKQLDKEKE